MENTRPSVGKLINFFEALAVSQTPKSQESDPETMQSSSEVLVCQSCQEKIAQPVGELAPGARDAQPQISSRELTFQVKALVETAPGEPDLGQDPAKSECLEVEGNGDDNGSEQTPLMPPVDGNPMKSTMSFCRHLNSFFRRASTLDLENDRSQRNLNYPHAWAVPKRFHQTPKDPKKRPKRCNLNLSNASG
ncbi:hypothetical protein KR009_004312 [Drosophila setifemur]|nr:hypothetical protein KR009_004312 [Drosophila setifemur]